MFRYASLIVGWLSLLLCPAAEAQYVRVGPLGGVNIRGPLGSVDVLPFGAGTRIRSPQTSIDTGLFGLAAWPVGFSGSGYRYDSYTSAYARYPRYVAAPTVLYRPQVHYDVIPVYPVIAVPVVPAPVLFSPVIAEPVYATPIYIEPIYDAPVYDVLVDSYDMESYPMVDDAGVVVTSYSQPSLPLVSQSIDERLREAAQRLRDSLATRRDDSDIWLKYLGPDKIIAAIEDGGDAESAAEFLPNYDGVAGNSELNRIWSADGFWQTHEALRSWLKSSREDASDKNESSDTAPAPKPASKTDEPKMPAPAKSAEAAAPPTKAQAEVLPAGEAEELPAPGENSPFQLPPSQ